MFEEPEGYVLAIEYMDGGALNDFLGDGGIHIPWTVRNQIGCDVASGLGIFTKTTSFIAT